VKEPKEESRNSGALSKHKRKAERMAEGFTTRFRKMPEVDFFLKAQLIFLKHMGVNLYAVKDKVKN